MRLLATPLLLLSWGLSAAESSVLPNGADIKELQAYPSKLTLNGGDDAPQLLITAVLTDGRLVDLTGDAAFSVGDRKIAEVMKNGRVLPLGNGATTIMAAFAGKSVQVPLNAVHVGDNLPVNFANQVVPVFTKLGCNSGGCHGKASGQNGFRLSLLGFEPELDFMTLVKEDRGRRIFPAAPERSLLLMKASGQVAHGGGRKMEPSSDEYKLVRRWITSGMPHGGDADPKITKITVYPQHRVLTKQDHQQLAVYAHYSDGTVEDVTRRAQYETNVPEVARADESGLVSSFSITGQAAIMVRYQGNVTVFTAVTPLGAPTPKYAFEPSNFIDKLALKKWQELGIAPSELCDDETFVRRVFLDICGTLPTPKELADFLSDKKADKRERLVDALLQRPEYSFYFANKWADVLRVKRGGNNNNNGNRAYGTFAFHGWIRDAVAADKPYDEFVREILGAVGDEGRNPPTVWYKDIVNAEQFVDNASQVFLGLRLACANCHHHPYEKWSQDDYWGLAAFYARVGRKQIAVPGQQQQGQQNASQVIFVTANGNVVNKRTNKAAVMRPLEGEPIAAGGVADPRAKLIDWMVDAGNPFFAKAVANRYWAHFFSRGIVDPLDDMRVTNPPSNPELLDALAQEVLKNKFSLKQLIRTICASRVYQLSSTPNEFNKHDKQSYARYYPKRMSAEVLFDAVSQVTDSPARFAGMPSDRFAPNRAIMLPDESYQSYFLDVFGRPQRISACECERVSEANLAQTLHLLNSEEVQGKIGRPGGRVDSLVKDKRPDKDKVQELFFWCLGRKPSAEQLKLALDNIAMHSDKKKEAYENVLWVLINSKGFVFNQ
jgi:Protein of unknown function (DUF1549)/Protein of unknown function (DUF1553)